MVNVSISAVVLDNNGCDHRRSGDYQNGLNSTKECVTDSCKLKHVLSGLFFYHRKLVANIKAFPERNATRAFTRESFLLRGPRVMAVDDMPFVMGRSLAGYGIHSYGQPIRTT